MLVLAAGISLAHTAADKIVSRIHKHSAESSMSSSLIARMEVTVSSRSDSQESKRHPQQGQKTNAKRKAPTSSSSSLIQRPHGRPEGSKKQLQKDLGDEPH